MCGIAGQCAFGGKDADENLVKRLVEGMRYRGPDHAGHFAAPGVALGMARLSIVDVKSGFQPLFNEQGTVALVCNGEIYNHQELRRGLETRGHRFKTGSDCETIVHLYEERGADCLRDLHGMFAFLLWDARRQTLFAARDRVGIKPLYYHEEGGVWTFSSEFGPLVRGLGFSPQIDERALWSFLTIGYSTSDTATLDPRVKRLAPGELLEIDESGLRSQRYWRPAYLDRAGVSSPPADVEALRDILLRTLDEHLVCEVPSAIMLSGGLDSTSVVVHAKRLGHEMRVVTAGYAGEHDCDERAVALETAGRLGLPVEEIVLNAADYARSFAAMMRRMDEPVADIAAVPQWEIYRRVGEMGVKVLHSGLGGDELFFGYGLWNDLAALLERGERPRAFATDDASGFYFHPSHKAGREFLEAAALRPQPGLDEETAAAHGLDRLRGAERVYHLLFETWLPGNCLHLGDRLSMAHSVELRVPFLDDRLVTHVQGLPLGERFAPGQCKPLLKRLLLPELGEAFLNRPKRGFTPPRGFVRGLVEENAELLLEGNLARVFFDRAALRRLRAEQPDNDIWYRMLVFEKWREAAYSRAEVA